MQTAIDWLIEQLIPEDQHEGIMDIIEDAKQREKQQIIDAFDEGSDDGFHGFSDRSEQYYNETYGSKGSDESNLSGKPTSSQTEISDEEIEKAWSIVETTHVDKWVSFKSMFIEGVKWYREQLKKK